MRQVHIAAVLLGHGVACVGFPGCATVINKPPTAQPASSTGEIISGRTSGVAPLAVFFDATGNDHGARAFHELGYDWSFGDSHAGVWRTTGRSKDSARGPLAAHVFETPGTYTVTATVTDSAAAPTTRSVTITVEDPDTVFAGAKTICFATGADFTGCPSGAEHVTLTAFDVALQRVEPGRRLLFRRGDTFSGANGTELNVAGPGIIGAFGDGPPPDIDLTCNDALLVFSARNPRMEDWRIMDLNIVGSGSGFLLDAENTIKRITILRLSMSNVVQSLSIGTSKLDQHQSPLHEQVAIVDCSFHDIVGNHGIFVSASELMVLGNTIVSTHEHIFRAPHVNQGVLSDNRLGGGEGQGHTLALHAESIGGEPNGRQRPSVDVVINGNIFAGHLNDWSVSVGPQGEIHNEVVRNAILDGNHFIAGPNNQLQLHLAAQEVTVRNNIFDLSSALEATAIHVVRRGVEPPPDNNWIYNNTCYSSSADDTTCVVVADDASNTLVHNNLLVAPNAGSVRVLEDEGAGTESAANLTLAPAVFANPPPVSPNDFNLVAGSESIDAGVGTGIATVDFAGTPRNADGDRDGIPSPDVGAFEFAGP